MSEAHDQILHLVNGAQVEEVVCGLGENEGAEHNKHDADDPQPAAVAAQGPLDFVVDGLPGGLPGLPGRLTDPRRAVGGGGLGRLDHPGLPVRLGPRRLGGLVRLPAGLGHPAQGLVDGAVHFHPGLLHPILRLPVLISAQPDVGHKPQGNGPQPDTEQDNHRDPQPVLIGVLLLRRPAAGAGKPSPLFRHHLPSFLRSLVLFPFSSTR